MPDATPTPAPAPAPVTPAAKKIDALFVPESFKTGATQKERIESICSLAEPILGAKPGEKAYVRRQPGGKLFVTLSPDDLIRNPTGGTAKGPRYTWETQPNGVQYGYLKEAASGS